MASLLEKPEIPISAGSWPAAMFNAAPVMNAEMAVKDMKSTSHPIRSKPNAITIAPAKTDKDDAMTSGSSLYSGTCFNASVMTSPVTVESTATGLPKVSYYSIYAIRRITEDLHR